MPLYDYHCRACGQTEADRYYATWKEAPQTVRCPSCLARARQVVGTKNFIHPSLSTLYGRPEPALGGDCFESYDHKRKLLDQLGAIEASDRVHGAKLYQDQAHRDQPPKPTPTAAMVWGDPTPAESAKE